MNKKMKIFIAGHTGLIGSACASHFMYRGYNNLITRSSNELDLTNQVAVNDFFAREKPEYVVLSAGKVGGIHMNINTPASLMWTNLQIQNNVMHAARQHACKRVIVFGSSCMYPKNAKQPMSELDLFSGKPEPSSLPYAISKMAAVYLALAMNKEDDADRFIPLIPNSVYGANDNFGPSMGHVLSALVARFSNAVENNLGSVTLWGSGQARREFIFSEDLASACLHLMFKDKIPLETPINIGTGYDISIRELAEKIGYLTKFSGEIIWDTTKPEGSLQKLLDSSVINGLGWKPITSLDQGLKYTINWYQTNSGAHTK